MPKLAKTTQFLKIFKNTSLKTTSPPKFIFYRNLALKRRFRLIIEKSKTFKIKIMNLNFDNQQFIFANIFEYFKKINTFIFDVDGVLTNNQMLITEAGELLRTMNARDGFAMKHALQNGYRIAIITGGRSQGVIKRLQGLGIKDIFSGIEDKLPIYRNYLKTNNLNSDTVLYMGDDIPDLDIMRYVGLATCPADATPEIIEKCNYISPLNGGAGCVRDVIEKTMKLRGHWHKKTTAVSS